jgi:heterodisulfide reductase subunit A-like polyferredoxin
MNTLPFQLESELDVTYSFVHPQLCGQGGNEVVVDIMRQAAADPETYLIGGACAPEAQSKLFRRVMRNTGFPEERFVAVDIRGTDNEGILARLRETVQALLEKKEGTPASATPAA